MVMLGELPFASRRNLFGLWNQTLPELAMGLFSILTFFSSWKSAWSWGADARFSLMRPRRDFRSAGESGSARRKRAGSKSKSKSKTKRKRLNIFRLFDERLQRFFAPGLRFSRSRRRSSEKDRRGQTPKHAQSTGVTETGQGWVVCRAERTESADRGETGEDHRLHHSRDIVVQLSRFLPDEQHVDAVIDADRQDETEREDV